MSESVPEHAPKNPLTSLEQARYDIQKETLDRLLGEENGQRGATAELSAPSGFDDIVQATLNGLESRGQLTGLNPDELVSLARELVDDTTKERFGELLKRETYIRLRPESISAIMNRVTDTLLVRGHLKDSGDRIKEQPTLAAGEQMIPSISLTPEEEAAFGGYGRFGGGLRQPNGLVITKRALVMEQAMRRIESGQKQETIRDKEE